MELNDFEIETAAACSGEAVQKLNRSVVPHIMTDMRMETETAGFDMIDAASQKPCRPATAILTDWKQSSTFTAGLKAIK